jgi:replicative DNA helicase
MPRGTVFDKMKAEDAQRNGEVSSSQTVHEGPRSAAAYRFTPIDSAAFAVADYRPTWLIKRLLVRNQPCIVGGPRKALKTTLLVDLALSLGTGSPFLGEFEVNQPVTVALLSGESGEHTLQETARRVCHAKGIDLAAANCLWSFRLPQLADVGDLGELHAGLREHGVHAAIIDPLYLCLLSGQKAEGAQASNLFDMGPLLMSVAQTCISAGATPILIAHARKNLANPWEALELEDLAFAGIQEFARQWLLVSRRERYEAGSGLHKLWLTAGGSVGHGGLWAVDVDEGQLDDQFGGRKWHVAVRSAAEARDDLALRGDAEKRHKAERQDKDDDARVLGAIDRLTDRLTARAAVEAGRTSEHKKGKPPPPGRCWPTQTDVRGDARLSSDRVKRAIQRLIDDGLIEETTVEVGTGKNCQVRKKVTVLRRRQRTERTERTELFCPLGRSLD